MREDWKKMVSYKKMYEEEKKKVAELMERIPKRDKNEILALEDFHNTLVLLDTERRRAFLNFIKDGLRYGSLAREFVEGIIDEFNGKFKEFYEVDAIIKGATDEANEFDKINGLILEALKKFKDNKIDFDDFEEIVDNRLPWIFNEVHMVEHMLGDLERYYEAFCDRNPDQTEYELYKWANDYLKEYVQIRKECDDPLPEEQAKTIMALKP